MLRDCPFQKLGLIGLIVSVVAMDSSAQPLVINYDEAKVPGYRLSDPLVMSDGRPVHSASAWYGLRRPEILDQMTAQKRATTQGPLVAMVAFLHRRNSKSQRRSMAVNPESRQTSTRCVLELLTPRW